MVVFSHFPSFPLVLDAVTLTQYFLSTYQDGEDDGLNTTWDEMDGLAAGLTRLTADGSTSEHGQSGIKRRAVGAEKGEMTGVATKVVADDVMEAVGTTMGKVGLAPGAEEEDEARERREKATRAAFLAVIADDDDEEEEKDDCKGGAGVEMMEEERDPLAREDIYGVDP